MYILYTCRTVGGGPRSLYDPEIILWRVVHSTRTVCGRATFSWARGTQESLKLVSTRHLQVQAFSCLRKRDDLYYSYVAHSDSLRFLLETVHLSTGVINSLIPLSTSQERDFETPKSHDGVGNKTR